MLHFVQCFLYLAVLGTASFFVGRLLPKDWFSYEKPLFRCLPFEREGQIYNKLGVRRWKELLPDMSVLFPALMPSKKLPKDLTVEHLELMIQETCVAEWTHWLLCIAGFGCVLVWDGLGGWLVSLLYVLVANLPYIIIQRYNRPKLVRILHRLQAKSHTQPAENREARADLSAECL